MKHPPRFDTGDDARALTPVEDAWFDILKPISWRALVTLTYRYPQRPHIANRDAEEWVAGLESEYLRHLPYVAVIETWPRVHVHALLAGIGGRFMGRYLRRTWRKGILHAHDQPADGAVRYMARKAVAEDLVLIPVNLASRWRRVRRHEKYMARRYCKRGSGTV